MTVALPAQRQPRHDHVVHVYDTEQSLVDRVSSYLRPALEGGDAVLVVATGVHRARFAAALTGAGLDVAALRAGGRYVERDAEETLASFSPGGTIDPTSFALRVGGLLRSIGQHHGRVHVYGEMVARLWARGDVAAAVHLEQLWNELATVLPFRLCCAYPSAAVADLGTPADVVDMLRSHTGCTRG